jgi:phosphoribosylformimino-5-aminoimidazole carboxamide ribotide isomerase
VELIPAIDLKEGRVVRLLQGDFDAETRYDMTAQALYERYVKAGARTLHLVDLDAARGRPAQRTIWQPLAADGRLQVQLGGGLRSEEALTQAFDDGICRAVIGSLGVTEPATVADWLRRFGAERLVLALDVRLDAESIPRLTTHGWLEQSEVSLWDAITYFHAAGLRHVLCTDVACDGALNGPNLSLYREARERCPDMQWIASGGVRHKDDLAALAAVPVQSVVSGRALLEGHLTLEELQPYLPAA